MNEFEKNARARKVAKMIEYFDRRLRDEYGWDVQNDAAKIVLMLRDKTDNEQWKSHALLAGQRKPGPDTVAMVIAEYERRAGVNRDIAADRPDAEIVPFKRFGGVH